MTDQDNKYKNIKIMVIGSAPDKNILDEDAPKMQEQELIARYLLHFGCHISLKNLSDKFSIEELQEYQMIVISVLPDRTGIKFFKLIQKKMLKLGLKRNAKFIAYTACGKAMVGMCMNYGFDDVLEAPALLKDYEILLNKFFGEGGA